MPDISPELLFDALNEQGYLFQERCAATLRAASRTTRWEVEAADYPVSLDVEGGAETRIDLVLKAAQTEGMELYAVAECKRANPDYVSWLFGSTEGPGAESCYAATKTCRDVRSDFAMDIEHSLRQWHLGMWGYTARSWMEVKTGRKTGRTSTSQTIESAFVQVLTGSAGLAQEYLRQRIKVHAGFDITAFIPVVITTASLYVAEYSVGDVDLDTGTIPKSKVSLGPRGAAEPEKWVLVHYNAGESLAPHAVPDSFGGVDPSALQQYKLRSVFVVNSSHLVEFFGRLQAESIPE